MAGKSWRLVVTDIGGSAPISEASVEAGNWMTALSLARKAIGEAGGVPPGASCSVAPDGKVTIQDAVARRTYVLAPNTERSLVEAKPKGPRVPAETVPRKSAPPQNGVSAVSKRTVAYDAKDLGFRPPQAPVAQDPVAEPASQPPVSRPPVAQPEPAAAKKPVPKHTVAYDAKELGLQPSEASAEAAPPAPKSEPVSKRTIAYDAKELGLQPPAQTRTAQPETAQAQASQPQASQPQASQPQASQPPASQPQTAPAETAAAAEPSKPRVAKHTIAYDAKDLGLAPAEEPEAPERATLIDARSPGEPHWELLHARDEEPTAETPLTYRERVFVVPPDATDEQLDAIVRARFEELRDELADRPKGKLVNLALFDHAWTEGPRRPPLLTLQWKDWRGDPVIQRGPRAAASPASSAPASQPPASRSAPEQAQGTPAAPASTSQPGPAQSAAPAPAQSTAPAPAPSSQPGPAPSSQPAPAQSTAPAPNPTSEPAPAQSSAPASAASSRPAPAASPSDPAPAQDAQPAPASTSQPAPAPAVASEPPPAPSEEPVSDQTAAPSPSAPPQPAPAEAEDDLGLSISDDVVESRPRLAPARVEVTGDDRLASAFEALQDLFFLTSPMDGLDFVLQLLEDLIPTEATSACLYDINTDELRFAAVRGPGSEERRGEGVPRLSGLMGTAALDPGAVLVVEDVANDPRFDPGVDGRVGLEPRNMALLAVTHQGRLMGLLQLIDRHHEADFSQADANLLAYVGDKLGEFLHAARARADEHRH